jgi:chaperonin cofactor prefoldin
MLIEDLYKQVEKLQQTQEMNMTNKVNIEFLTKQMEKALVDIEKLKDSNREIKYNGNGQH